MKEKNDGLESELKDLKNHIIQEHIYGFHKGLRQATFFCKEVDATNSKDDVNKDVVDGCLVEEVDSSLEQVEEVPAIGGKDPASEEDAMMHVKTDHAV